VRLAADRRRVVCRGADRGRCLDRRLARVPQPAQARRAPADDGVRGVRRGARDAQRGRAVLGPRLPLLHARAADRRRAAARRTHAARPDLHPGPHAGRRRLAAPLPDVQPHWNGDAGDGRKSAACAGVRHRGRRGHALDVDSLRGTGRSCGCLRRAHAAAPSRDRLQPAARAICSRNPRRNREPRRRGDRRPGGGTRGEPVGLLHQRGVQDRDAVPRAAGGAAGPAAGIVRREAMTGIFSYLVFFACVVLIFGVLALGLNLQWGFTGLFNAGIVGFYAIGAYTHAILTAAPQPQYLGNLGLPWIVGILAAMAATALAAWVIALLTIRLRGDYLAIATSGIAVSIQLVALNWEALTAGSQGLSGIPKPLSGVFDTPLAFNLW